MDDVLPESSNVSVLASGIVLSSGNILASSTVCFRDMDSRIGFVPIARIGKIFFTTVESSS